MEPYYFECVYHAKIFVSGGGCFFFFILVSAYLLIILEKECSQVFQEVSKQCEDIQTLTAFV